MCASRRTSHLHFNLFVFFFFNDTATTEIYTLSLHDALPISCKKAPPSAAAKWNRKPSGAATKDRKSTRLNSSHPTISYAVFCLKKKNKNIKYDLLGLRQKTCDFTLFIVLHS